MSLQDFFSQLTQDIIPKTSGSTDIGITPTLPIINKDTIAAKPSSPIKLTGDTAISATKDSYDAFGSVPKQQETIQNIQSGKYKDAVNSALEVNPIINFLKDLTKSAVTGLGNVALTGADALSRTANTITTRENQFNKINENFSFPSKEDPSSSMKSYLNKNVEYKNQGDSPLWAGTKSAGGFILDEPFGYGPKAVFALGALAKGFLKNGGEQIIKDIAKTSDTNIIKENISKIADIKDTNVINKVAEDLKNINTEQGVKDYLTKVSEQAKTVVDKSPNGVVPALGFASLKAILDEPLGVGVNAAIKGTKGIFGATVKPVINKILGKTAEETINVITKSTTADAINPELQKIFKNNISEDAYNLAAEDLAKTTDRDSVIQKLYNINKGIEEAAAKIEISPLFEEAKKYKTPEEFIKSQQSGIADSNFITGKAEDFYKLQKSEIELENRIDRARVRQPYVPNELKDDFLRGGEEILNRLRSDTSFGMSAMRTGKNTSALNYIPREQVDNISVFIDTLGSSMFDDVGLSIWGKGTKQGQYNFSNGLVTIYKNSILKNGGDFDRTMIHELWHSASRYLPTEKVSSVINQYKKDISIFLKSNPGLSSIYNDAANTIKSTISKKEYDSIIEKYGESYKKFFSAELSKDRITPEYHFNFDKDTYRLKNIDEWFAEHLTDTHLNNIKKLDENSKSVLLYLKNIFLDIVSSAKSLFKKDVARDLYKNYVNGNYIDKLRDTTLGRANTNNIANLKSIWEKANNISKVETPLDKATKIAKVETPLDKATKIANGVKQSEPFSISKTAKNIVNKVDTTFISEYNPIKYLEKKVYKANDIEGKPALNMARRFEQVNGAAGKAHADLLDFDNAVITPIKQNLEDFNTYLFLKRTESRLINNPEVKKVGEWTLDDVNTALKQLSDKTGKVFSKIEDTSKIYQEQMDKALQLQVDSGRISREVYNNIKGDNDFYAPFKVMKYIEESGAQQGTRPLQNLSDYTKAITGINDSEFELQNILLSSKENIYKSRILAEQNKIMSMLGELKDLDKTGLVKQVSTITQKPEKGFEIVRYFKNGVEKALQVPEDVAVAVRSYNAAQTNALVKVMKAIAVPMRYGATTFNLGFSAVNFISDNIRVALVSKYGVNNAADIARYPMDLAHGLFSSFRGNFGIGRDAMYEEFLKSGAANSTFQKIITPDAFVKKTTATTIKDLPKLFFDKAAAFSSTLEEATKISTLKRALRYEDVKNLSGEELGKVMQDIVYEVRNFGGSPDFARSAPVARDLNTLFMFFNARLQGVAVDVSRVSGIEGKSQTAKVWARTAVASVPLIYVALLNQSDKFKDDYNQRTDTEKKHYIMIPSSKTYIDSDGLVRREYYRIPKRGLLAWTDSTINSAIAFMKNHDPKAFLDWGSSILGDISPVNFSGNNVSERLESIAAGMNPFLKVPAEYMTNRNFFFHTDTVSKSRQDNSPELQYSKNTPEFFKWAGQKLGESPAKLEQAVQSLTGGFVNQFTIGESIEGRSKLSELPVFKRFYGSTYFQDSMLQEAAKALTLQHDKSDLLKEKAEQKLKELDDIAMYDKNTANAEFKKIKDSDPKLAEKIKSVKDEQKKNYNYTERLILQMGVSDGTRATFIFTQMEKLKTKEEKNALYKSWRDNKLISDTVKKQILELKKDKYGE